MNKNFFVALLISFTLSSCAYGEISKEIVESAWRKIATTDGFAVVKINYEKDKSPNAWVAFKSQKNFSVHVTAGLMKILNTEEQIAGVLGHEIGHVRLGHYNKGVGRSIGWSILDGVLSTVGTVGQVVGSVGMNLAESGFSRQQEVEADDYGVVLLKKAGYDPRGLYRAMKAFADNKYVTRPSGFNSHPPTARRLKHLLDKAKEVEGNNKK